MSQNEYILIIGAGSGIGRETAYTFAERGSESIFLVDSNEQSVTETAEASKTYATHYNFRAITSVIDVTDRDEVEKMVTKAIGDMGRIDAAINCAGVGAKMEATVMDMPTNEFDRVYNVNARGLFFCTSALARVLLNQEERFIEGRNGRRSIGRGSIVNLSSLNAQLPVPLHVQYGSSKYAAAGVTFTAATELARKGVRVNCLMPSWVDTNMMAADIKRAPESLDIINRLSPAGRMAMPEEIAEAVYFLCSPGASYIHGIGLVVDAGLDVTRGFA